MHKKAIVVHSGGMDSSICLALAIDKWGRENVLSLSFRYQQRHSRELECAVQICQDWQVDHIELNLDCLAQITDNALTNQQLEIVHQPGTAPNTLVAGRNGLMALLSGIHAHSLQAHCIYLGVIEVESGNSGYRDCDRAYMDRIQALLRIDLADDSFTIHTPVVHMSKAETLEVAHKLGILTYLLTHTISCYRAIPQQGCQNCPACQLRNQGLQEFLELHPEFTPPYALNTQSEA